MTARKKSTRARKTTPKPKPKPVVDIMDLPLNEEPVWDAMVADWGGDPRDPFGMAAPPPPARARAEMKVPRPLGSVRVADRHLPDPLPGTSRARRNPPKPHGGSR